MATSSFYSSTGPNAEDATALEGYKTQAAASADAAATSATDAASSASSLGSAVSSAQNAQAASEAARDASVVAKNAAANSATTASNAIATTAASATSAATSATTATTKASEAATSATSASNSASTATTKASEASTSASNASTSESNAATSASAAATAKTNAETAETNAETAETNAAASATTATTKASEAAASATSASTSAGTATTKAGESSTSATNASTSATNASNSATSAATAQTAAEAARDAALAAFDSFDDRYLGQKSSAPTVDNDGNALVAGTLYFNTTTDEMKVYDGSQWLNAYASLSGALLATSNLSDLNNAGTARTNLGLGTAATTAASDYATAAQADQTVSLTGAGATSISGTYPNFTITSTDTNTTYSVGDGGLTQNNFTDADHSKLNAIEASADVTDTANVTAAGALMDSELTSEASVKALNQGVATGDSPTFAGLTVGDGVSSKQILVDAGAGWADLKLHSDATNGGSIYFNDGADAGQIFYYHPENSMRFHTNASERMRIDGSGNAIFTKSGGAYLQLKDASAVRGAINVTTSDGLVFTTGSSFTERMRITDSGVGIGTSSPSTKLHLVDSTPEISLTRTSDFYYGRLSADGFSAFSNTNGNAPIIFKTATNERMRITDSGVGIGTSSPVARLEVHGAFPYSGTVTSLSTSVTKASARIRGSSDASTSLYFGSLGNDAEQYIQSSNDSGTGADEIALNPYGGNVLVGQTSNAETGTGIGLVPDGTSHMYSGGTDALMLGRGSSDGDILSFNKSGTTVGSIGTVSGDIRIGGLDDNHASIRFAASSKAVLPVKNSDGGLSDNTTDLGASNSRFKDLHLSGRITSNQPSTCFTSSSSITLYNDGNWRKIALNSTKHQTGGNHFNSSNNRFTAPVAGRYLFGMDIQLESVSGAITWMYIVPLVNGTIGANNGQAFADFSPPNSVYNRRTGTFLLNLSANDYVEMWQIGAGNGTVVLKANTESSFFLTLL